MEVFGILPEPNPPRLRRETVSINREVEACEERYDRRTYLLEPTCLYYLTVFSNKDGSYRNSFEGDDELGVFSFDAEEADDSHSCFDIEGVYEIMRDIGAHDGENVVDAMIRFIEKKGGDALGCIVASHRSRALRFY